jgi:hypothetical protein
MRFFVFFTLLGVSINLLSQVENYVRYINPDVARNHLEYLASDELEGREAGEKGQKLAGAYLMQNFLSYGLPPVNESYFQRFSLRVSTPKNIFMILSGDTSHYFTDFLHNSDFPDNNFKNAESVFIGYGISLDKFNELEKIDVKDKVCFMLDGIPEFKKRSFNRSIIKSINMWRDRDKKNSQFGKTRSKSNNNG